VYSGAFGAAQPHPQRLSTPLTGGSTGARVSP